MEGKLLKWTNYLFGWRERFFVLKGNVLYYYYKKNDKPRGRIHLGVTNLIYLDGQAKFDLDTGTSMLYIKAASVEERDNWIQAIKLAKIDAENKMTNTLGQSNARSNFDNMEMSNRGASIITEDKLLRKINHIQQLSEKLQMSTQSFGEALRKNEKLSNDPELNLIYRKYKTDISSIYTQLDDLKKSFIKFNKDFIKLSEYFFNNPNEANDYRGGGFYHGDNAGLLQDNNLIELARAGKQQFEKRLSSQLCEKKTSSNEMVKRDDDIFYGAEDSGENNFEKEPHFETFKKEGIEVNQGSQVKIESVGMIQSIASVKQSFYDPLYAVKRTKLPAERKQLTFKVWDILKDAVGRDINKFCVPVFFNEPLSMLQRLCENFQYADLLNRAAAEPNPYMRLCLVGAFCIGGFAMNIHRATKFFNPLLSETYEYVDNEKNFRYISEQVSHHPAISACWAEGDGYSYYTNSNAASKFHLTGSIEIHPLGRSYLSFPLFNETVTYTKPKAVAKNLIFGNIHVDCFDNVNVNNNNGDTCEMYLVPETKTEQGRIIGEAKDIYGKVHLRVEGNWLDKIDIIDPQTEERQTIWKLAEQSDPRYFYLSEFGMNLNNLTDEMKESLPPTDSRFRPDQRLLELQELSQASTEKHRLEEKQRAAKKYKDQNKVSHKPLYFEETYDDITGELIYKYKGNYFQDRYSKNFSHFPDIF